MLTNISDQMVVQKLRKLYQESPEFRTLFIYLANRERSRETPVTTLERQLEHAGHKGRHAKARQFAKVLEELGFCKYIIGRHGHPSRLKWKARVTAIGRTAIGSDESEAEDISVELTSAEPEIGDNGASHAHELMLRTPPKSFVVRIKLPLDLTDAEKRRISDFILTLPSKEESETNSDSSE